MDIAGVSAVMQVERFTRMVGHGSLALIAARRRMPTEVLAPVFDRMAEEGYLTLTARCSPSRRRVPARPG
ncbi:hypothetical protein GCM10027075_14300 [Streptomyces heilongjiangensis]